MVQGQGVVDVAGGDAVLVNTHDQIGLVLQQMVDGLHTHLGSGQTVTQGGVAAADGVAQIGEAGVDPRLADDLLLEVLAVVLAVHLGHTLGADGDDTPLAVFLAGLADLLDGIFAVKGHLGNGHRDSTRGDGQVQGEEAALVAHDLGDDAAGVGLGGIAEGIEQAQRGVQSGVEADGLLGGGDIVIDGGGNADGGDAVVGQVGSTAEGTVSADGNDRVDVVLIAGAESLVHALGGGELGTAAGVQDGAAAGHDVGHAGGVEGAQVALTDDLGVGFVRGMEQTRVAAEDTHHLKALTQGAAGSGTDRRVHTGGIAARGKNTDSSEVCHDYNLLPPPRGWLIRIML